jgi:hypothetical protein
VAPCAVDIRYGAVLYILERLMNVSLWWLTVTTHFVTCDTLCSQLPPAALQLDPERSRAPAARRSRFFSLPSSNLGTEREGSAPQCTFIDHDPCLSCSGPVGWWTGSRRSRANGWGAKAQGPRQSDARGRNPAAAALTPHLRPLKVRTHTSTVHVCTRPHEDHFPAVGFSVRASTWL